MRTLRFSSLAKSDLAEIAAYIAKRNPTAARAFVRRLREHCQQLKRSPWIGEVCPQFQSAEYRQIHYGSYAIFYEVTDKSVLVSRVIHSARDWGRMIE
jgi:toxin ParE1/3/4